MEHFWEDVPGLGNVAVSRHAQNQARKQGITEERFVQALFHGEQTPDGLGTVWREAGGVRLVILLRPQPFRGAKLVKTVFVVQGQERAR